MKRRNRLLRVLISALMIVVLLAGCGGGTGGSSAAGSAPASSSATEASGAESSSEATADGGGTAVADGAGEEPVTTTPYGDMPTEPVTIRLAWSSGATANNALRDEINTAFMEMYPSVTLSLEAVENSTLANKISMDVAANNTPDVFSYWRPEPSYGTDKFIEAGALTNLDELLTDPYFGNMFEDFSIQTGTVGGHLYGIPCNFAYIVMFANKEVFDACGLDIPTTWQDWVDANKVIKENGYIPFSISTRAVSSGWERPLGYVLDRFCPSEPDDSKAYINNRVLEMFAGNEPFNTLEAVTAFEHLYDLVAGNAAEDAMTLDDTQVCEKYFNSGRAAVFINGTYGIPGISKETQEKCVPMIWPEIPGASENRQFIDKDVTSLWYISSAAWGDPVKKPVVYEYMKLHYSERNIDHLIYDAGNPLPLKGYELDTTRVSNAWAQAHKIMQESLMVKWPLGRMKPEAKEEYYPYYTEFWSGKYTGEEFANIMHDVCYTGA